MRRVGKRTIQKLVEYVWNSGFEEHREQYERWCNEEWKRSVRKGKRNTKK